MAFPEMLSEISHESMTDQGAGGRVGSRELERLRERVAQQEQTELVFRAREAAYRSLLSTSAGNGAVFELPLADGRIGPDAEGGDPAWPRELSPVRLREKAALAVERRRPVEYKEIHGSGVPAKTWKVHLAPVLNQAGTAVAVIGRASTGGMKRAAPQRTGKADRLVQSIVELLPDAVIVTNVAGQVIHINTAGVQMLGVESAGAVVGRSVWDLIHPEEREAARERARRVQKGEQVGLNEHRLVRSDGSTVPVETLSVSIRYGGRPAMLSTARDISGRKELEEELSESRELFFKAFKASPAGYIITRLADGRIIDINDEYLALTGYGRDELVGRTTVEMKLLPGPDVREGILRGVEKDGSIHQHVYETQRKDGEVRRFLTSIQRAEIRDEVCLVSVVVDITDREAAALAARESRDLLYRVFHASPAAIAIVRLSDGHYIDVNEHWCSLTGYSSEEVIGHSRDELGLWPNTSHRDRIERSQHSEDLVSDIEAELQPRSGDCRTVLVSTQNLLVRGEPSQLIVLTDITERKQMELDLVREKERAEEMSRMKTAFLTNMTHEVRTPLTVILGFTSMLRQGVREEYQRFVRVIERSGRRLLLMLDSILDLAQLEAGTLTVEQQVFSTGDVVRNEAELFRSITEEKGLSLDIVVPEEHIQALADHKIFVRVLNNLFDNAVKFTEKGGVTLRVGRDETRVYVSVEDTGQGIDEAFLPKMWEAFAQESTGLERTHQGSGLGLTVSKRLLELMNGSIEVESTKGHGSRFTAYVPLAKSKRG